MLKKILLVLALVSPTAATTSTEYSAAISLFNEKEVNCLAKVIYHEARGEPVKGQQAVAIVTVNRAFHPSFPSSICKVVYQKSQYSWTSQKLKVVDKGAWSRARDTAYYVLNNYDELKSFKALYFHSKSVSPNWGKKRIARIGNHVFYT